MHYNWGIVGSGWIAHDMASALIQEGVGIYGVASGHYSSAQGRFDWFCISGKHKRPQIVSRYRPYALFARQGARHDYYD